MLFRSGAVNVGAFSAAMGFGRVHREGAFLGGLFAVLAAAAFFRIGAYTGNIESSPLIGYLLAWGPIWGWLGAAVVLTMAWSLTRRQPA